MGFENFHCAQCGYMHDSQEWYVKKSEEGILAYVCGTALDMVLDRSKWKRHSAVLPVLP